MARLFVVIVRTDFLRPGPGEPEFIQMLLRCLDRETGEKVAGMLAGIDGEKREFKISIPWMGWIDGGL